MFAYPLTMFPYPGYRSLQMLLDHMCILHFPFARFLFQEPFARFLFQLLFARFLFQGPFAKVSFSIAFRKVPFSRAFCKVTFSSTFCKVPFSRAMPSKVFDQTWYILWLFCTLVCCKWHVSVISHSFWKCVQSQKKRKQLVVILAETEPIKQFCFDVQSSRLSTAGKPNLESRRWTNSLYFGATFRDNFVDLTPWETEWASFEILPTKSSSWKVQWHFGFKKRAFKMLCQNVWNFKGPVWNKFLPFASAQSWSQA